MVSAEFQAAADKVNNLTSKPTDEQLLKLYGLFKQANVGDVNTSRPGMMDFKGKAKWDAWKSEEGKSQEAAEAEYIAYAEEVVASVA
ncbi:hypothetical protein H072_10598 [Dactylellina haptotyla CBS 200.50]|uniref:ACB domain-containing protein n=1 Tax=Dactylellina haptotyla (strain CBS 200.50) TaxID=1284197 RepID=S7ZZT2_DACHA|nr:hypothetical protein H072_10598 [Dactylellina haptotyla CBS 200.50]